MAKQRSKRSEQTTKAKVAEARKQRHQKKDNSVEMEDSGLQDEHAGEENLELTTTKEAAGDKTGATTEEAAGDKSILEKRRLESLLPVISPAVSFPTASYVISKKRQCK